MARNELTPKNGLHENSRAIRQAPEGGVIAADSAVRYGLDGRLIIERPTRKNTIGNRDLALKAARESFLEAKRQFEAISADAKDVATRTRRAELIAQGHQLRKLIQSLSPKSPEAD